MHIVRTAAVAAMLAAGLAPVSAQEITPEITPEIERLLDCGAALVLGAADGARQGEDPAMVEVYDIEGNALLDRADELLAAQGLDYDTRYDIGVDYATRMDELFAAGGEPGFEPEECRALLIEQAVGYDAESLLICGSAFAWAGAHMTRRETGFEPVLLTGWGSGLLAAAGRALTAEGFTEDQRDILIGDHRARVGRAVGAGGDIERTLPFCEEVARGTVKGG